MSNEISGVAADRLSLLKAPASRWLRGAVLAGLTVALAACGSGNTRRDAYDDGGRPRIPILTGTGTVEADPQISTLPVRLPKPYVNKNWAQAGGNALHLPQHLSLGQGLSKVWEVKVGRGDRAFERTIAEPVVAEGLVFTVDSRGDVAAHKLSNGAKQWDRNLKEGITEQSRIGYGGGVSYSAGRVYVASGYGFLVALDAQSGSEIWRYDGAVPLRGAPTVSGNFVFATTLDNQILALNITDGEVEWDQVAIAEAASMLGASSVASNGTTVIAALSSGELIAMLQSNGRILWQDTLTSSRRLTPLSTLTDIDGDPVINGDRVIAASHAGRMVAVDMRSGERSWEADVASVHTPWVAGDFAFLTTIDSQVVAVSLRDGRVRWVQQLQRFTDQEARRGLVSWNGPVLASDRLIVTSNHGYALSLSPYDGSFLSATKLPDGSTVAPVVVDNTLLVLTTKGDLVAYR